MMKKLLIALTFVLTTSLALSSVALADAPWSLFGTAAAVKDNTSPGPNSWVVQLVSNTASPGTTDDDYGGITFRQPNGKLTFAGIAHLSADYNITDDDCGGGSPRFSVGIDMDGDGDRDGAVFIYFGPTPNFTGCATGWQNTGNLIQSADLRFDTSQVGGTFYDSYAHAVALVGDRAVISVALVADGGWFFGDKEQTLLVDNVKVNNFRYLGK